MAEERQLQLVHRPPRHSFPFSREELQEVVRRAAANQNFDSSLKLRPILPRLSASDLAENYQLPSIQHLLKKVLSPQAIRSLSLPSLPIPDRPIKIYEICGKNYIMNVPDGSDSVVTQTRVTQDGRELTYRLEMCQQPRQARACGNGARSSADRRPVDPPPVISLTIKHGNIDITSSYEAAFMLFASLEHARPHARGTQGPTHVCPVITGVCVAGAAYLAKPSNAAYFIFPDLSVRHEGFYRLKFHLFEQTKRQGDMDEGVIIKETEPTTFDNPSPERQHENMVNRAFIYSAPFQVFSAKKFPGLQPSTELSKVIADQGCRVRIRRDVRQRRAGDRKSKGDEDHSRGLSYSYQRAESHDNSREQRRMSIDSQASHSYTLGRHPSYAQSTMPSPALPDPSRYAQDRTAPSTPIVADSEHKADPRFNQPHIPPFRAPSLSRAPAAYALSSPSTSASALQAALPSVAQMLGPPQEPSRPAGGLYDLPAPTAQKRGARSPESSSAALKDGARPSIAPPRSGSSLLGNFPSSRMAHESRVSLCYGDAIIAADDDEDDEDESGDEILDNPYTYRRATGDKITTMRQALQMLRRR